MQRAAQQVAAKFYISLRPVAPVRKLLRAAQARRFHANEERFDVFHAINYVPPGKFRQPVLPFVHDLSHVRHPQMHPKDRVRMAARSNSRSSPMHPWCKQTRTSVSAKSLRCLAFPPSGSTSPTQRPAPSSGVLRMATECGSKKTSLWRLATFSLSARASLEKTSNRSPTRMRACRRMFVQRIPLVWCGPAGWGDLLLSPSAERARDAGQIRIAGYVPDRELAALYRNCTLFVMASVYEGFGMPVVEAMACGARIAVSKIPAFQEIVGDYGRYVEPLDVEEWRRAIGDAIEEACDGHSIEVRQPDLTRFSWQSSAASDARPLPKIAALGLARLEGARSRVRWLPTGSAGFS